VPGWSWLFILLWILSLLPLLPSSVAVLQAGESLLLFGSTLFIMVYRYMRVFDAVQRQQTKWFVYIIAIGICLGVLVPVLPATVPADSPYQLLSTTITLVAFALIPLGVGIAILRYRLWDIDLIINRTLVYGALTASIIGMYILIVGYLGALFRTGNNLLISLVATGLVAVLFQPLRELLQRAVNRLLYGQRDEPYTVITQLSQRLKGTLEPEAVISTIVETVAQALKLPYAAILWKQGETFGISSELWQFNGRAIDPSARLPGRDHRSVAACPARPWRSFHSRRSTSA
jgi:hypothetical protein